MAELGSLGKAIGILAVIVTRLRFEWHISKNVLALSIWQTYEKTRYSANIFIRLWSGPGLGSMQLGDVSKLFPQLSSTMTTQAYDLLESLHSQVVGEIKVRNAAEYVRSEPTRPSRGCRIYAVV